MVCVCVHVSDVSIALLIKKETIKLERFEEMELDSLFLILHAECDFNKNSPSR